MHVQEMKHSHQNLVHFSYSFWSFPFIPLLSIHLWIPAFMTRFKSGIWTHLFWHTNTQIYKYEISTSPMNATNHCRRTCRLAHILCTEHGLSILEVNISLVKLASIFNNSFSIVCPWHMLTRNFINLIIFIGSHILIMINPLYIQLSHQSKFSKHRKLCI